MHLSLQNVVPTLAVVAGGALALTYLARPKKELRTTLSLGVVITGSSKGLGFYLAREFLRLGDRVVISGSNDERLQRAFQRLQAEFGAEVKARLFMCICDVRLAEHHQQLGNFAKEKLGTINIWINNAGVSQDPRAPLKQTPVETIQAIVDTNLLGTLFGTRVAIDVMEKQGFGQIFNMEGAGSDGRATPTFLAYGASKAGFVQLLKSLSREVTSPVGVHNLSPGLVLTDLLLHAKLREGKVHVSWEPSSLWVINTLAETPQTVTKWLVPQIRAAKGTGKAFRYLTPSGALWKMATWFRFRERWVSKTGVLRDIPELVLD